MYKVILVNSADVRTEHEFATLDDAMGECGPKYPLILDGHAGHLEFDPKTDRAKFVGTDHVFQFFAYANLKEPLQSVSRRFYELAEWTFFHLPRNPERTVALRHLKDGKDAAVCALVATS